MTDTDESPIRMTLRSGKKVRALSSKKKEDTLKLAAAPETQERSTGLLLTEGWDKSRTGWIIMSRTQFDDITALMRRQARQPDCDGRLDFYPMSNHLVLFTATEKFRVYPVIASANDMPDFIWKYRQLLANRWLAFAERIKDVPCKQVMLHEKRACVGTMLRVVDPRNHSVMMGTAFATDGRFPREEGPQLPYHVNSPPDTVVE